MLQVQKTQFCLKGINYKKKFGGNCRQVLQYLNVLLVKKVLVHCKFGAKNMIFGSLK